MKGLLIALEGVDSSGKHTQAEMLVERLKENGKDAVLVSFPRYDTFSGALVKQYLQGKFGSLAEVKPEFSALLYALDRYNALPWLEAQLSQGKTVVCDRYVASNAAHQGSKLHGSEQKGFIEWIEAVESRLPKPDLTIFLDLPVSASMQLMQGRARQKDIHELSPKHLEATRQVFLSLARKEGWACIECSVGATIKTREEIHEEIWEKVTELL